MEQSNISQLDTNPVLKAIQIFEYHLSILKTIDSINHTSCTFHSFNMKEMVKQSPNLDNSKAVIKFHFIFEWIVLLFNKSNNNFFYIFDIMSSCTTRNFVMYRNTTVAFCVVIPMTPVLPLAVLLYDYSSALSSGIALDARVDCWTQKSPLVHLLCNSGNFSSSFKQ